MKKTCISFILLICSTHLFSQKGTIKVVKPNDTIKSMDNFILPDSSRNPRIQFGIKRKFVVVEKMPEFPGGRAERNKFINTNIKYPKAERDAGISGMCYISFAVQTDGTLSEIQVLKGVPKCPNCDKEAIRIVSMMPKWVPGMQNGKAVEVQYTLPIGFPLK